MLFRSGEPSAIRVLGMVGGPAVVAPLAKKLDEGKLTSHRAVIEALGNIRHPDAAAALVKFYPKANDAEKVDIFRALSTHPHPAAIELMTGQLRDVKVYPAVRRRAALSLGNLRATAAIPALSKALLNTTEDENLRLTCVQALGNFSDRDDAAIAALIGALADKKMADEASLALNRVTHRYFGADKEKWTEWFQQWVQTRDTGGTGVGH